MDKEEKREYERKWYAKHKTKINQKRRLKRKIGLEICKNQAQQKIRVLQEQGIK